MGFDMEPHSIWSAVETNLLWWVICAIIASVIGAKKGRLILGFLLGFLCGPIGILITLLIKGNRRECLVAWNEFTKGHQFVPIAGLKYRPVIGSRS